MSDANGLRYLISSFGETSLSANTSFYKDNERLHVNPYEEHITYIYKARLADLTNDYSKVKSALKTLTKKSEDCYEYIGNDKMLGEKIHAEIEVSIIKSNSVHKYCVYITYQLFFSEEKYQCFELSYDYNYVSLSNLGGEIRLAMKWLESTLTTAHIIKDIVSTIRTYTKDLPRAIRELSLFIRRKDDGKLIIGDTITMGQEISCNEPVKWRVLDVDKNKNRALVVSENVLFSMQPYESAQDQERELDTYYQNYNVSWSDCDINHYLNSNFRTDYGLDKADIISVTHETEATENASKESTNEKVFLLSISEAEKYFKSDDGRKAKSQDGKMGISWLLRTPGAYTQYNMAQVGHKGSIDIRGEDVAREHGIRPAFWVNL